MAQRAMCSVMLILMVLLGPMPALTQRETRHEKFVRQHVDFPKTRSDLDVRRYCNLMMQRRGMTDRICKNTNTFIHGEHTHVHATCSDGGTYYSENYYDSNTPFSLTICRFSRGSPNPPCNYRGRTITQRIRVACLNGEPVHFKAAL